MSTQRFSKKVFAWSGLGLMLVLAGAAGLIMWSRSTPAGNRTVLASCQQQLWEVAGQQFYAYAQSHAVSGPLQRQYFDGSDRKLDHFRFLAYLDKGLLPTIQQAMRLGSAEQRKTWIEQHRRWVEHYRLSLTGPERERLQLALRSPAGQQLIDGAAAYMLSDLSASEKIELQPLIQELITTLEENTARR